MRKAFVGTLVILAVIASFSCSLGGPEAVASGFLKAMSDLDFEKAAEFATKDSESALEAMKGILSLVPAEELEEQKGQPFVIKNVKIEGEKAIVEYEQGDEGMKELSLIKENGEWKVVFSKDPMSF